MAQITKERAEELAIKYRESHEKIISTKIAYEELVKMQNEITNELLPYLSINEHLKSTPMKVNVENLLMEVWHEEDLIKVTNWMKHSEA